MCYWPYLDIVVRLQKVHSYKHWFHFDTPAGVYRVLRPDFCSISLQSSWTFGCPSIPGLVTSSILFCRLYTIKDWRNKVREQQTHKGRHAFADFNSFLGPLHLARHTWWCPCFSVVPVAKHKVEAQGRSVNPKALHGSATETRDLLGGTTREKYFPDERSLICPQGISMILYKRETEKLSYWPNLINPANLLPFHSVTGRILGFSLDCRDMRSGSLWLILLLQRGLLEDWRGTNGCSWLRPKLHVVDW